MKILIVEDEDILRISIGDDLRENGFQVSMSKSPLIALNILKKEQFNAALVDLKMPDMNGIELLKRIRQIQPECSVVIMTAFGTIQTAVEAIKLGAYDFVTKPFSNEELIINLHRIKNIQSLKNENIELKRRLKKRHGFHNLIGKSKPMQEVFDLISIVAESTSSVLITGATGTGKEVVADAIHYSGPRQDKNYIKVSCALLSRDVLESELFGHVKGAFTGAHSDKKGRFELTDKGTIFLDDVDDIPFPLQVKLLRILQNNQFERVGDAKTITVDVRVIAASKLNLLEKIKTGEFREDLYYRLNVVPVNLPSLQERKDDIPLLIDAFAKKYSREKDLEISKEALDCLLSYNWPGNVRELENLVERLVLISQGEKITCSHLPVEIICRRFDSEEINIDKSSYENIIRLTEINLIEKALAKTGGNKALAARVLKLKPSTLKSKIDKFKL